jgi:hypothetical protein
MRSRFVGLAAIALAAVGVVGIWLKASESPQPKGNGDPIVKQLLDRVAKLEARVAQLEERQPQIVVPYSQPAQSVPKEWQRGEINGLTFYIVPLASSQSGQRNQAQGIPGERPFSYAGGVRSSENPHGWQRQSTDELPGK